MRILTLSLLFLVLLGCDNQTIRHDSVINAEFRYMADAALIVLCETGRRYPVAMEQAYIDLERAYLSSGVEPGSPAGVAVTGEIVPRPAMEGDAQVPTYVVTDFRGIYPGQHCPDVP